MYSIIFGILASVLPNLLFRWLYFLLDVGKPQRFIKYVYISEGLKFLVLAFLISVFIRWPGIQIHKFIFVFLLSEVIRLSFNFWRLARIATK